MHKQTAAVDDYTVWVYGPIHDGFVFYMKCIANEIAHACGHPVFAKSRWLGEDDDPVVVGSDLNPN